MRGTDSRTIAVSVAHAESTGPASYPATGNPTPSTDAHPGAAITFTDYIAEPYSHAKTRT